MKVLFFGIQYHTYTDAIIAEMEALGAEVTFVDLQPRAVVYKVMRTLARPAFERMVRQQLVCAVEVARSTHYDKVVFLQAHQMPLDVLVWLRETQPQAQFSLYNWDAITTHNYLLEAPLFDEVYTFDPKDAEAHGFHYLPLFCPREMQGLARDRAPARSVYTVGNIVNPRRYDAIKAFAAYCGNHGIVFEAYMKISPLIYLKFLRMGRIPRGVSLRSIDPAAFNAMIERSAATFDFANHQAQSGHTMRTFENLCGGKKIITNNRSVLAEDFYCDDRFFVYDGFDFTGVAEFLDEPLNDPSASFEEYYIQSFARTLLGLTAASEAKA